MRPNRRLAALAVAALALALPSPAVAQGTVEVSPITARLDEATTTTEYTIQVLAPADADIQVNWNKPSCGTWERPAPTLFRWTHPHPPCTDPLLHPDEVITVIVTIRDLDVRFTCTYRGADSGEGGACASRSLGLTPTPTPTPSATPTAPPTSAPSPTTVEPAVEEPSELPMLAALVGGAVLAVVLVVLLVVAIRRRRERALDPCAPRQRRGMGYLADEIAAYAAENRAAALLVVGHGPLSAATTDIGDALGDLWVPAGDRGGRGAWSSVLGTDDGLVRSTRNPELAGRARGLLGPEGPWRAASEAIASRITRRTGIGYPQRSPGWSGAAGSVIGRLAGSIAEPAAAAIAANAFASAAIAAADALERLNEASDAAGCPTVPIPDVAFVTVPADADAGSPGARLLVHRLTGGDPTVVPLEAATSADLPG